MKGDTQQQVHESAKERSRQTPPLVCYNVAELPQVCSALGRSLNHMKLSSIFTAEPGPCMQLLNTKMRLAC